MNIQTFAVIVVAASALVVALAYGVDRHRSRRLPLGSSEERTPIERPAVNTMNTPVVLALFYVGGELRRAGDIMQDLARAVQASPQQLDEVSKGRIARELKVTAHVVEHAALEVEGAT